LPTLLPLLRKNLLSVPGPPAASAGAGTSAAAGAITVAALDWTLSARSQIDVRDEPPEVLLVVDCIYHPTLVSREVDGPRNTVALVVAELWAEDVLPEFLEAWIALGWIMWSATDGIIRKRLSCLMHLMNLSEP